MSYKFIYVFLFLHLITLKSTSAIISEEPKKVDPARVVTYDDMLNAVNDSKKLIIDVRNPDETKTGMIPSSRNIPLPNMKEALVLSNAEFQRLYKHDKPSTNDELIFYCQIGKRSTKAMEQALKLGYNNSKVYLGSWAEWSSKQEQE